MATRRVYENPEITEVRNIQPKTRAQRGQTRDELEKARLEQRTGGFTRYENPADVLIQPPTSLAYATDADRFNRDTAGMEKLKRDEEHTRKELMFYGRRTARAEREEQRWSAAQEEHEREERKLHHAREAGSMWKANKGSMPYDVISMKYHEDTSGQQLRYSDDMTRFRASHRAAHLHSKDNATGFNPITGEKAPRVQTLDRPRPEDYTVSP
mmetsp:Transcript_22452/g.75513  ORF Transcript_22452/g.75513 Transcript_22452/m.75513 type:complete len:212 (-) Transcript_22452:220-855(-)